MLDFQRFAKKLQKKAKKKSKKMIRYIKKSRNFAAF